MCIRTHAGPGLLTFRASYDALTALFNRAYLQECLVSPHRNAKRHHATYSLLLDLDHFEVVNDRFGHATGNQVLAQGGRRIVRMQIPCH